MHEASPSFITWKRTERKVDHKSWEFLLSTIYSEHAAECTAKGLSCRDQFVATPFGHMGCVQLFSEIHGGLATPPLVH